MLGGIDRKPISQNKFGKLIFVKTECMYSQKSDFDHFRDTLYFFKILMMDLAGALQTMKFELKYRSIVLLKK